MKRSDDYSAKLEMWAAEPRVYPLPQIVRLPRFKAMKFKSHAEMNAWKQQLLDRIASQGGVRWRK